MIRTTNSRSNSKRNSKAQQVSAAAQQVSAQQVQQPQVSADVPQQQPQVSDVPQVSARQSAADAGAALASVLGNETCRKALQSAIGNVKRSDLLASASETDGRTRERLERADIAALASRLATAAQALTVLLATPAADLRGANISVRIGSVSALALLAALADANSKADALSQFASVR